MSVCKLQLGVFWLEYIEKIDLLVLPWKSMKHFYTSSDLPWNKQNMSFFNRFNLNLPVHKHICFIYSMIHFYKYKPNCVRMCVWFFVFFCFFLNIYIPKITYMYSVSVKSYIVDELCFQELSALTHYWYSSTDPDSAFE